MKKTILFLLFIASFSNNAFSQLTPASVEGISPSRSITYTNPITNSSETRTVGLCFGKIYNPNSGPDVCYYSIDITKAPGFCLPNFDYINDSTTVVPPKICYIIHTYYPAATGPGQLSNLENETAAIQAVIWNYTNGLNLNTITSTAVKNRALAIKANVDINGLVCAPTVTFSIIPGVDPDYFAIKTTNDNGAGIAVNGIAVSISQGSLSDDTVNTTAPSGLSAPIEVIGSVSGIITARSKNVQIPKATVFRHISNQCPKLVLACPGPGELKITADWGALPVEMTLFNSTISGKDVQLNWTTASELNNSHFNVERNSAGTSSWINAGVVAGNGSSTIPHHYTYTDKNLTSGRYQYRLKQSDFNGNFTYYSLNNEVEIGIPAKFEISQNYPNPFNPSTKINFDIPKEGFVSIKVFDHSGKEVENIVNEYKTAGFYSVNFTAANLSSGIYFYRIETGNFVKVMKMAFVK